MIFGILCSLLLDESLLVLMACDFLKTTNIFINKRPNDLNKINYVFLREDVTTPLTNAQLAEESGLKRITEEDYPERIMGDQCNCEGPGEFVLLPKIKGEKRYMQCRICGGYSHL